MKVLVIVPNYPNCFSQVSGVFFKDQVEMLSKSPELEVTLLASVPLSLKKIFRKRRNQKIHQYTDSSRYSEYVSIFAAIPKMKRLNTLLRFIVGKNLFSKVVKNAGLPDIVHAHSYKVGELPLFIKEKHNIPFILTEHYSSLRKKTMQKWEIKVCKRLYDNSKVNTAVSKDFSYYLKSRFECDFTFIPNVVDTEFFVPPEIKENQNGSKNYISIGFLNKNKNHESLILAFDEVFHNDSEHYLKIGGGGDQYRKLEELIKEKKISEKIILLGELSREEVRDVLQKSDYFILPSRYETFGVVLIEAMSCGLPVVATRCGGPESIIVDEGFGILCENSIEGLKQGLIEIEKKNFNSEYIREHVLSNYSAHAIRGKFIELYQK